MSRIELSRPLLLRETQVSLECQHAVNIDSYRFVLHEVPSNVKGSGLSPMGRSYFGAIQRFPLLMERLDQTAWLSVSMSWEGFQVCRLSDQTSLGVPSSVVASGICFYAHCPR